LTDDWIQALRVSFPPACGGQVKTGIQNPKIITPGFLLEFIPQADAGQE
jgi:hypothetical protein